MLGEGKQQKGAITRVLRSTKICSALKDKVYRTPVIYN